MNKGQLYIIFVLLFCCLTKNFAQDIREEILAKKFPVYIPVTVKTYDSAPQKSPVHLSPIYPWGIHGTQSKNHIYNFSMSLVAGMVRGINGLQLSGVYSQAPDYVNGVQIAGLGGNSTRKLKGVQIGGVTNYAVHMKGIQIAGFANAASYNAEGIQISGFINGAAYAKGIQIGAMGNAAGNMTGIQIGGISNLAQTMTGAQISVMYNRVDTLRGISISVVSFADTIEKGFAVSLVNIVRQGSYRGWELSFADYANVAVSYRMGTPKLYRVYTTGASFIEDNRWITGIGFGNCTPIGNRFDFQPELVSFIHLPTDLKHIQGFETRLKFGFVYRLNETMGLSLAPSVYVMREDKQTTTGLGISLGLGWRIN